jgi:3-dehydroquinate synthase
MTKEIVKKLIGEDKKVSVTSDTAGLLGRLIAEGKYKSICVITDHNTSQHCFPVIREVVKNKGIQITIPAGEEFKNLNTCSHIWSFMTDARLDRKSLVINLGGGVIGDMGGFCASTYKRGIDFIQIPTTLLSQVDASVGGKLGIDFAGAQGFVFKNHIGVFKVPSHVIIDTQFLKTLSPRELRSGFAEIIKHCLIVDANQWAQLKTKGMNEQNLNTLVPHSIDIKDKITTADPEESGLRKILNFGHTIGHAIESFYLPTKKKLLHGEAIAIGMICEAYLSVKKGFISDHDYIEIAQYLLKIYGTHDIADKDIYKIIPLTLQDKKTEGDVVLFSLLEKVGKGNYNIAIHADEMAEAIEAYRNLVKHNGRN